MESVGGLFCIARSPSHGSTSRASTTKVGQAPDKDCTTSALTSGYFYCPAYDFYYSTSHAYYI